MTEPTPDDLAAIEGSDALLDRLGAGGTGDEGDSAAAVLGAWQRELEAATPPAPADVAAASRSTRRWRRNTAGLAVVAVALTASTGVAAAAASGSHGPLGGLHRLIFGGTAAPAPADPAATQAAQILQRVAHAIDRAGARGGLSATDRALLGAQLDRAQALLDALSPPPRRLVTRLASLRARLAALRPLGPSDRHGAREAIEPGDDHGSGGHGRDDSGSDDGAGGGGDDHSGHRGSGGTSTSGSDDGSTSRSDDGSGQRGSSDGGSSGGSSGDDGSTSHGSGSDD